MGKYYKQKSRCELNTSSYFSLQLSNLGECEPTVATDSC